MRLSDWRTRAPHKDAMTPKVIAVIEPVLAALGAEPDPSCWIVWGDDPAVRYVVLAPTDAGLLQVLVRVNVPQEGPRASAKVIRWNRVQLGELGLEMADGHRLLGFQVEGHVLRGADDVGDEMAAFALELFARVDGREFNPRPVARSRAGKLAVTKGGAAKPAARKAAASSASSSGLPAASRKQAAGPSSTRG
jgi:hypothetical protein